MRCSSGCRGASGASRVSGASGAIQMNLASFAIGSKVTFGAVVGDGIVDLGARLGPSVGSLQALLEADRVPDARAIVDSAAPDGSRADVRWLRPVLAPEKIFCVGVNYTNRNEEYRDESALPKYPSVFMRTPGSLVGHLDSIVRPPESAKLDYEGEIAIIIGRRGRRIPETQAEDYIAGVTCLNEGTIRDWTRHGKFNVTQGKNFERTGGIGPWLATTDDVPSLDDLTVTTRVNGERRQHDSTANLLFSFRYIVAYLSTFAELAPGDVIATGTPIGAGIRQEPPCFLVPGDRVEVEVSGVGTLVNDVIDEPVETAGP